MKGNINPTHANLLDHHNQKKQFEKSAEIANKQLMFQTRKDAIRLAIEATTDAPEDYTTQERDGLIMTRAILYEQYMLNGSAAIKFTEKKQEENGNTPVQEKEKSTAPDF